MEESRTAKTHRIGSVTFGCALVIFGSMFLAHIIVPALSYSIIFHLWPCIFILLGIEILVANHKENDGFVYDKAAIFMIMVLTFFAMAMAFVDWGMQMAILHQTWCW